MRILVIIGGMGSGKSSVSRLLGTYGVPVLDLDEIGHEVLFEPTVADALSKAFGADTTDTQGQIMRTKLAAKAFASEANTQRLNAITSPAIINRAQQWLSAQKQRGVDWAAIEISAYDGPNSYYAKTVSGDNESWVVAVVAPLEKKVSHARKRGFESEDIMQRIQRQPSDEMRRAWADYVIDNSGTLAELEHQVESLWKTLNA